MGDRSALIDGLRPLVDLVYPPRCVLCGEAVVEQGGLCAGCFGELEMPGEPACPSCNRPMVGGAKALAEPCFACLADPPRHSGITAATLYNDTSRALVLNLKHGGKLALAGLMGRLIAARLPEQVRDSDPLLVPVPLHRWRLWKRGFNQAALIARELSRRGVGEVLVDGLVRERATRSLGGLGRAEREAELAGAIVAKDARRKRVVGRSVILVDDVLTSGATLRACVGALMEAGAECVHVACFARVKDGHEFGGSHLDRSANSTTPEAMSAPGAT